MLQVWHNNFSEWLSNARLVHKSVTLLICSIPHSEHVLRFYRAELVFSIASERAVAEQNHYGKCIPQLIRLTEEMNPNIMALKSMKLKRFFSLSSKFLKIIQGGLQRFRSFFTLQRHAPSNDIKLWVHIINASNLYYPITHSISVTFFSEKNLKPLCMTFNQITFRFQLLSIILYQLTLVVWHCFSAVLSAIKSARSSLQFCIHIGKQYHSIPFFKYL